MIKFSHLERDIFPDQAQQIRWLQLVLAGILLILCLFFLVANLFPHLHPLANNNFLTLPLIASCLVGEWLLYRRQLKPAYYLLVVSFYIVLTLNLYLSATVWFLSIIGYFGLITLSFLFSERRQGVFLTAVIVLTVLVLHFFIPTTANIPPPAITFSLACTIPLHAMIIFWLTKVLSAGFQEAQKQSEALAIVNQELAHHKRLLEKHVQERTAELAATNDKLQLTVEEYRSLVKELRLLESAVEHTSDAIVLINTRFDTGQAQHYLQYINPAFTRLLGYAPADVLGQSPEVLFGADKTAVLLPRLTSASLPPEGLTEELVIERLNGTELWIEATFTAVWQNHQLDYWVAVLRDISQRKQVEQQLRLMESVATKTHNGVAILDTSLPHPQMAYVNDGFCHLTGYTADTAVGKTLHWLHGPATNPDTSRQIQEATSNHTPLTAELVLYRQDNTPIWCALNLTPVFNHNEELTHWVTILTDISHRKELDEQLLMLNAVVANATEGVVITKIQAETPDQNVITYVNQAFTQITGQTAEQIIGRPTEELITHYADPDSIAQWFETYDQHHNNILETRLARADGSHFWAQLMMWPIYEQKSGAVSTEYWVTMVRDVTAVHDMEDKFNQAQKLEAIGRLAGGVAHDFNNLLTIMLSNSDLLLYMEGMPTEAQEYLQAIYKASKQATNLTRQLLAFSRHQSIQPQRLQLNEIIQDMEHMISRLIGEDIVVRLQLNPNLYAVRADPGQLQQVLMNLAVNARDAMPNGGELVIQTANVTLYDTAQTSLHLPPGDYITWSIRDTGEGMTEETVAHIFEPFFTTKQTDKGTGLGLSTVYGIVQQNGGDIRVHSRINEGTVFTVFLPRTELGIYDDEYDDTWPVMPELPPVSLNANTAVTILIVEDEPDVRNIVANILTEAGYHILTATDGHDAWQLYELNETQIDLILTDVVMPHLSGPELAQKVHAHNPDLPILYMTGYPQDFITTYGPVENQYIVRKPFTANDLLTRLRTHLP